MPTPPPPERLSLAGKIAVNTGVQVLGRGVSMLLNAIAIIAMIRYLGAFDYGNYVFITSFVLLFGFIGDFGISRVAIREMTRAPEDVGRLLWTSVVVRIALSVLAVTMCVVAINALGYPTDIRVGVYVASAVLLVEALKSLNSLFHAHLALQYDAGVQVAMRAVDTGLVLWLVATGGTLLAFLAVPAASGLVSVGLTALILWRRFPVRLAVDWSAVRPLLLASLPIALTFFFSMIFLKADGLLLWTMVGEEATGIYGVAYKPIDYLLLVVAALFVNAVFPVLARLHGTDAAQFTSVYRRSFEAMLMLIVPVAVATTAFADPLVELVFSSQYAAAAEPMRVLMWAAVFMFVGLYLTVSLTAIDHQHDGFMPHVFGAGINVGLNLLLIPLWSYMGSAVAILVTVVVVALLLHAAVRRRVGTSIDVLATARVLLASLLMGGVMLLVGQLHWVAGIIVGGLAYPPLLFLCGSLSLTDLRAMLPRRVAPADTAWARADAPGTATEAPLDRTSA